MLGERSEKRHSIGCRMSLAGEQKCRIGVSVQEPDNKEECDTFFLVEYYK